LLRVRSILALTLTAVSLSLGLAVILSGPLHGVAVFLGYVSIFSLLIGTALAMFVTGSSSWPRGPKKPSRYERYVPADVRRLAEERGIPKPNVWVP
jgi:hypothetical protein